MHTRLVLGEVPFHAERKGSHSWSSCLSLLQVASAVCLVETVVLWVALSHQIDMIAE